MTADEKLAALQGQHPERIISLTERMVNRGEMAYCWKDDWRHEGFVAESHTKMEVLREAIPAIVGIGDLEVTTIALTENAALDALADALAKLEGKCPKCAEREDALVEICFEGGGDGVTVPRELATVKDIVALWLRAARYDGLCTDNCGCLLADLMPCAASDASSCDMCVPGHKVAVDPEESEWDRDWAIVAGPREHSLKPQSERDE